MLLDILMQAVKLQQSACEALFCDISVFVELTMSSVCFSNRMKIKSVPSHL